MKPTCTLPATGRLCRSLLASLLGLGTVLISAPAQAQTTAAFPRNETFKGNSVTNFSFGGAARLTAAGPNALDANGQGYLRLTDAVLNQAGYAIDNVGFPAGAGFTISFEFFSYGKTTPDGADGFSVFLVDAVQPSSGFRIGATGGSLGYAQKTIEPISDGVTKGYIGIGIDEFGNYSNGLEGRSGGSAVLDADNKVPNGIAIRGAGNGSAATDYPYLAGTQPGDLDFSLDVPTARAQSGSTDYRRAYIDVVPTTSGGVTTYRITVRIQHGNEVRTAIQNFQVPAPPANLRLGFAGSTGGSNNVHEIRNLNLVQVPFAGDDVATTPYNINATVPVLLNDVAPGSTIDPTSVDLDPNTAGRQAELNVPGKGRFTVNALGVVTFVPTGSFAGTVTVPYTVQTLLGAEYTSSPANITVTVQGADVATAVTGPNTAQAGDNITYTMRTRNDAGLPATTVVPKIQLPAGLSTANVTAPGGTYNPTDGVVTFGTISNLASGAQPVQNTVTFRAPTTGPVAGVATAASAVVPDPQVTNNSSSVTTNIGAPLPVELVGFDAKAQDADAVLSWRTAQEKNNERFEVERSQDGRRYELVRTVPGRGNTTAATDYTFRDRNAAQHGLVAYYRLRQVDFDGSSTLSPVRVVRFAAAPATASLYPNPAAEALTLDLSSLPAGDYQVRLLDATGRVVRKLQAAGAQRQPLGLPGLPPGAYVVQVLGASQVVSLPLVHY